jgi:hypothetical protein
MDQKSSVAFMIKLSPFGSREMKKHEQIYWRVASAIRIQGSPRLLIVFGRCFPSWNLSRRRMETYHLCGA